MVNENKDEGKKKLVSRREFLISGGAVIAAAALAACTSKTTVSTTSTTISTTSTTGATSIPASTSTSSTTGATSIPASSSTSTSPTIIKTPKVLKIGFMGDFSASNVIDAMKGLDLITDIENKNGGIAIGGDKYNIQFIKYEGKNDQATENAAINRLIFQDKVNFILAASVFDAFLPTTDENKVVCFITGLNPNDTNPKFKYVFSGMFQTAEWSAVTAKYCKLFPDATKNVVRAYQDNQGGHFVAMLTAANWKVNGVTPDDIFYPATMVDLSSVGTQVVSRKATTVTTLTGSDVGDGQLFNAVYQAGYRGVLFSVSETSLQVLMQTMSKEAIEGFICGAFPTEFDPPLTQTAADFKNAWIAKYGKWENPAITIDMNYYCLKAGLQQAGSLDVDAVAGVISNGMKYDTPYGSAQMMSRPDVGNNRTVDSIGTFYLKKIHNQAAELVATVSIDEALGYYTAASSLPPPGPPPGGGGPPPG